MTNSSGLVHQGFSTMPTVRIPLIPEAQRTAEQKTAADVLINGPRKGVKGPFVPLLHSPVLMERLAGVGEYLRFETILPRRINEFVTLIVARHVSNQFEWSVHYPLALAAGTAQAALDALAQGARPPEMSSEEAAAYDFTNELLNKHGVSDLTYAAARTLWNEQGVVELTALVGYFACVSWVMNVARTPFPAADHAPSPLNALPA